MRRNGRNCPAAWLGWPHVRSVCLQPGPVRPRRGVRDRAATSASRAGAGDYNVAPTKQVYAVVERPNREDPADPIRQLRVAWGLVPSWAKDPSIGNRLINARMETVAEKPAFRRAFATRRCLLPADGYYEWYPTDAADRRGKPRKQPFFIHPPRRRRAGDGRALRDLARPGRATDDDPDALAAWTCTVLTTDGRGRRRPHPRPDAADGRARTAGREWLDPADDRHRRPAARLLVPAAPGRLEAYPVSTLVNNVQQQRARAGRAARRGRRTDGDAARDEPDDGALV